jgi:MYND finger
MSEKATYPRTGVAYVAVIEHEFMNSNKFTICNNCMAMGFDKQLKRCNGCMLVDYCSKECQKKNWRKHKPFCNMVQGRGKKNT